MKFKSYFCASLCLTTCYFSTVSAEKVIQCIANFPIDQEAFTQYLKEKGLSSKVIVTDLSEYDTQLLKKKGKLEWIKQKLEFLIPSTIELSQEIEKIVFFNIPPKMIKKYHLSRLPKDKISLFMWEPKTVLSGMYQPEVLNCFSKVFTWDDSLLEKEGFYKFNYPVLTPMLEKIPSFKSKKLCTLVASNLKSDYPFELYSEREKVITYFEEVREKGFEFWGRNWDPDQHPSYRGSAANKVDTIKNYRFSICYENTSDAEGYITEKIFDCFSAGTVPVYWGAPNVSDYIPKDCFIDRRDFDSMEELHRFLKQMSASEYEGYLTRIRLFLKSEAAQLFNREQLYTAFYQAVAF